MWYVVRTIDTVRHHRTLIDPIISIPNHHSLLWIYCGQWTLLTFLNGLTTNSKVCCLDVASCTLGSRTLHSLSTLGFNMEQMVTLLVTWTLCMEWHICWHFFPIHENTVPMMLVTMAIVLIIAHPIPLHSCPCFVDSVCFVGAMLGAMIGCWAWAHNQYVPVGPHGESMWSTHLISSHPHPIPSFSRFGAHFLLNLLVLFNFEHVGWIKSALRMVFGLTICLVARLILKTIGKRIWPYFFRTNTYTYAPCLTTCKSNSCNSQCNYPRWMTFDVIDETAVNRIFSYGAIGFCAAYVAPLMFSASGLS